LRRLIDPSASNLRAMPKKEEDLFVSAYCNHLISIENVSSLSASQQDSLCQLSTGSAFSKRTLYTDYEETLICFKRPVVLNGISGCVTRQDLLDRTISIEIPRIESRVKISVLEDSFARDQPLILGAILDLMVGALGELPRVSIQREDRPRLLEFAELGMAIESFQGGKPQDFLKEFNSMKMGSIERSMEGYSLVSGLRQLLDRNPEGLEKSLGDILDELNRFRPERSSDWPATPRHLGDQIRRLAPSLRVLGIDCTSKGKIGGKVKWRLEKGKSKE